ncbi:MAG: type II toxin-antitoxin system VapC family toxin [Gammaproteobacteria bacterium]|nr:type II toxin-antitoxin system VapC family toxin [Gammaproteobacteria bacterium]
MSYLLDTNVVSELARPRPAPAVVDWVRSVPDESLHFSVLSRGELRSGVERLPPVSAAVADCWGRLMADSRRPLPAVDSLLAATALHHGLRMVTRNVVHFRFHGLDVIDPWSGK